MDVGTGHDENGNFSELLSSPWRNRTCDQSHHHTDGGFGFLSICAGDCNTATSIINWTSANVTVANASVIPIDASRREGHLRWSRIDALHPRHKRRRLPLRSGVFAT